MWGDTEMSVVIRGRIGACFSCSTTHLSLPLLVLYRVRMNEQWQKSANFRSYISSPSYIQCAQVPYEFYYSIVCRRLTRNSHIDIGEVADG